MTQWPEAIERFLVELTRWGHRVNLVGSTDRAALTRHVEDSLAAVPHLPDGARVVDLGSGAGFPGIPIAIARPDVDLTLVEIRERRASFLRHVVRTLGLGCRVERRRIEDPDPGLHDFAVLRAVAPPVVAAKLGEGWVRRGGEVWVWAGPEAEFDQPHASIPLASGGRILRIPRA
jgi:16S rRNA (guanine527-N7)-methyltransferase